MTSPRGDLSARDAAEDEDDGKNAKANEKFEKKVRKSFKNVLKHG